MNALSPRIRLLFVSLFVLFASLVPVPTDAQLPASVTSIPSLAPMLERVTPAIVNISVGSQSQSANPLFNDPYFRRFFDVPEAPRARPQMSAGSGVIIDAKEGYVLTNHHVIDRASEIVVTLKDGRRLPARLVGSDPATDIALIRIEASDLTAIPVGDSDQLRVGDYVVAIGNPFGLGQTVTSGIVSALGRNGINNQGYEDFIQTDASINPGNSGGALVTLDGRLVGINTAILSPAGGNIGIGFSVPSNIARTIADQLINDGEIRRGRIGVAVQDVTPDVADALGLKSMKGALISSVEPGSSAMKAGLRPGEIITAVDGTPVAGATSLRNRIGLTRAGTTVRLTVSGSGKERELEVTISEDDSSRPWNAMTISRFDGAELRTATAEEAARAGAEGVVVERVVPDSPAAQAGLRAGDLIVAVNRQPVSTPDDLNTIASNAGDTVVLDLVREGMPLLLVLR